jgi:hypothetical protein
MESNERAAVRRGLDALKPYLAAFVAQWSAKRRVAPDSDIAGLLKTILDQWDESFRSHLPRAARSYVHELLDIRNRWAHEEEFSSVEVNRALDTMRQLAAAMGVPETSELRRTFAAGSEPKKNVSNRVAREAQKWSGQRAIMRELYARWKNDSNRMVREYANAEREGCVQRKANKSGLSPEEYARALLADGEKKGWLI